jgi:TetR/AcrR family transcriptional regulator
MAKDAKRAKGAKPVGTKKARVVSSQPAPSPRAARAAKAAVHAAFDRDSLFAQRKHALAQAAIGAFNRHGFYATSMDAIAAELGLTKGTLYHYYNSKSDLLYDCLLQSVEDGRGMAEAAAAQGGRGVDKLERFLRLQFQTLAGRTGSSWLLSADLSALSVLQRADIRKKSRSVDAIVQRFIVEGMADGSIVDTEPKIAEFFLIGAMNWLPRWYNPNGRITSDELASIFVKIVLEGLRA